MPRLVINLKRATSTGDTTTNGDFHVHLGAPLVGLKTIVLESYAIGGVENSGGVPNQNYLTVQIDKSRAFDDEVLLIQGSKVVASPLASTTEKGFVLPIVAAPYGCHQYDAPSSRVIFATDSPCTLSTLRLVVTGPGGAVPLFATLTLHCRYSIDIDHPTRNPRAIVSGNHDSELPPGDGDVTLRAPRGNLYWQ